METRPNQILTLAELSEKVAELKTAGSKVVMCHGVFDLVHIGHIRHFEQARNFGDVLVVTLTPDRFVNKGSHRPAFPEALRAESVAALNVVDFVSINHWPTAEETIRRVKPDIYCKGGEYKRKQVDSEIALEPELTSAREVGARVEYTDGIVFSSSELLNRHLSPFPPETDVWLESFRETHSADEIKQHLDSLHSLKVLVVGEAIIDDYVYCQAIGKSTKDPVLACQYTSKETFVGGSLAIANHLAGFCDHVDLITCLGETHRQEDLIRESLLPNVSPVFITNHNAPTIHKRRFVDPCSQNKLLELYIMDDHPLSKKDERVLLGALDEVSKDYDVVIVADYGHGMFSSSVVATLCEMDGFLAVNTQSNAGNRGFNPISKYPHANYVCLAQHEIEIETRMRDANPRDLLIQVAKSIGCKRFTVTRGKWGSLHYEAECGFTEVPAFATHITDRVGAGDAVLALTSLLLANGAPWDIVGFVGNVAGAQMVSELGNRVPVSKVPLAKYLISLLK